MRKKEKKKTEFAKNLRNWIQSMGITVAEFCRRYKIKRQTVELWFKGERFPSLSQLLNVETSIDFLIEGTHRPVFPYFVDLEKVSRDKAVHFERIFFNFTSLLKIHSFFAERSYLLYEVLKEEKENPQVVAFIEFVASIFFSIYTSFFTGKPPSFYYLMVYKWIALEFINYNPASLEEILLQLFYPEYPSLKIPFHTINDTIEKFGYLPTKFTRGGIYIKDLKKTISEETLSFLKDAYIEFEDAVERTLLPYPCFTHSRFFWDECPECKFYKQGIKSNICSMGVRDIEDEIHYLDLLNESL